MSYRTYDIWILVMLLVVGAVFAGMGWVSRSPGFVERIWWLPFGLGIVILLLALVNIGFVATQPTKIPCPYCNEKVVPKVRMNGHLRLSRLDED